MVKAEIGLSCKHQSKLWYELLEVIVAVAVAFVIVIVVVAVKDCRRDHRCCQGRKPSSSYVEEMCWWYGCCLW